MGIIIDHCDQIPVSHLKTLTEANSMALDHSLKLDLQAPCAPQWRSQKAEKVTHIKGWLQYQATILYKCVPFQNGNFS